MATGFGTTFGAATTDSVRTAINHHAPKRTYVIRAMCNGFGGNNLGRIFEKRTEAASATCELLQCLSSGGTIVMQYSRGWSTSSGTLASWALNMGITPAQRRMFHFAVSYDSLLTTNDPVMVADGVIPTTMTESVAPSGTLVDNTDAYVLGNRTNDNLRNWDGTLEEWSMWDRLLTVGEINALRAGESPLHMGRELVDYQPLGTRPGPRLFIIPTGTRFWGGPTTISRNMRSWLAAVPGGPISVILKVHGTTHTPLPITRPRTRMINQTETFHTPLDITPVKGLSPAVASINDSFTASNGDLGVTADNEWTRYGGTRFKINNNKLSFEGSGFSNEIARLNRPFSSDDYEVGIILSGWQRGLANDVSQGLIFRKDISDLQTYYSIFVSDTAADKVLQLWRFLHGQAPLQITRIPVVVLEGEELRFKVYKLTEPTIRNRIIVSINSIQYIDLEDDKILPATANRYAGVHAYCQGNISTTVLQMDNFDGDIIIPPFVQPPRTGSGHKIKRNRRIGTP